MNKEKLFIIIAAVCLFSVILFMIGGVIQDVDYHDLAGMPLLEQKAEYDRMETRKTVGQTTQLIGAIMSLAGFTVIAVLALSIGHMNAAEAEKKYTKSE